MFKIFRYAQKSEAKIRWALSTFEEWRRSRDSAAISSPNTELSTIFVGKPLLDFTTDELNYSISRFISEARNKKGQRYPGTTLRELVLCLQMYLSKAGSSYRFLNNPVFSSIRNALDNTMKKVASKGIGLVKKQAEVITVEEEEILWEKGV